MRIGITGPNGRLASHLIAHHGCVPLDCDISKFDETRIEIQRAEVDAIINCAAYTDVDKAEKEQEKALLANVRGAGNVRMAFHGYLVHISTCYIFSGENGPYPEDAEPGPLSHYGFTKWGSEAAVASGGMDTCLIVRTMSLYGNGPHPDFVSGILSVLSSGGSLALPAHLTSNPTYIPHLAEALMWCVKKKLTGHLNLAGLDVASRVGWAQMVAKAFGFDESAIKVTSEVKGVAARPHNASLDLSKAITLGVPLYPLKKGLKELKKWKARSSTFPQS